ncbi:5-methylcytosine-specific restriction enzyme subunit McrC [Sphaerochaeta associata]|uniref:5-methylcytosine-specific restriction endonuclease system specificity protein McrC n=1 Tax=Sphaerochaeta associata TaxID=1129264 RepID=UPI000DFB8767|nr:5-methylcytosine-specific restriction endonuclease system specificity protein McrC [Sphaerochaeta associata]SMP65324.1 5-methylcytosine-specific restriction enzyme subunit McrC [Sphaerochaeta associata]
MKQYGRVFIKNIYYMLSYAFKALRQESFEDIAKEEFSNIHNVFAAILARGISLQLKQGLYREYLNRSENLAVLRGKIEMEETIQQIIAHKQKLTCEYDELSENNQLNQILKTTTMILFRHPQVDSKYKDALKKEMLFFSHVDTLEPTTIHWSAIRFQRNNMTYKMLISICQLVLDGMLMSTEPGVYSLASFVDDQYMHRLYEKFILEYYRKEYPSLQVSAAQISWALDDGLGAMLPIMQSDITLSYGSKVLIIDAKFYAHTTQSLHATHTIHSNNLYQIFTYVKNKDAGLKEIPHEVAGMLLYARTDETLLPNKSYQMSGNTIMVQTLDLNCDFSIIAGQLNTIVERIF